MKKVLLGLSLLASMSSFADQGTEVINPAQILVDAQKLVIMARGNLVKREEHVKNYIIIFSNMVANLTSPNQKINDSLSKCNAELKKESTRRVKQYEASYVDQGTKYIPILEAELKALINDYISASNCSLCDEKVREETLIKYTKEIKNILYSLRSYADITEEELEVDLAEHAMEWLTEVIKCDFGQFFTITRDREARKLGLSPTGLTLNYNQYVSGEYDETLEYVTSRAPMKIKLNAKRTGRPSNSFKKDVIKLVYTYDYNSIIQFDKSRREVDKIPDEFQVLDYIKKSIE
jgi:hypothetical protein